MRSLFPTYPGLGCSGLSWGSKPNEFFDTRKRIWTLYATSSRTLNQAGCVDMLLHSASGYININDKPPFDAESLGFNDLTQWSGHVTWGLFVCVSSSRWQDHIEQEVQLKKVILKPKTVVYVALSTFTCTKSQTSGSRFIFSNSFETISLYH